MLPAVVEAVATIGMVAGALKCAPFTGVVTATLTPVEPASVNTQSAGIVAVNVPPLTGTVPAWARFAVADV